MVTISHIVNKLIKEHLFVQEAISREIVSFNGVAKYLRPDIEKELDKNVKHSSIVMAIRRYAEKAQKDSKEKGFNYFGETILKTDICYIVIEQTSKALHLTQNVYPRIEFKKGGFFNIIQSNYELGILTNSRYKDMVLSTFEDEKILNVLEDLVVITLTYTRNYMHTPGVMYNVLSFLAWDNINMITNILTPTELSLVIKRENTMKCYNVLERMIRNKKKNE